MTSTKNDLLIIYLLIDLAILNVAIFATDWAEHFLFGTQHLNLSVHFLNANLAWVLTYIVFSKKNLYLRDGFINRIWRITKRTFIFLIISSVLIVATKPSDYSSSFFLKYALFFLCGQDHILQVIVLDDHLQATKKPEYQQGYYCGR